MNKPVFRGFTFKSPAILLNLRLSHVNYVVFRLRISRFILENTLVSVRLWCHAVLIFHPSHLPVRSGSFGSNCMAVNRAPHSFPNFAYQLGKKIHRCHYKEHLRISKTCKTVHAYMRNEFWHFNSRFNGRNDFFNPGNASRAYCHANICDKNKNSLNHTYVSD